MKKIFAIIGVLLLLMNMVSLPVYAEQTDLERVIELIESLPDEYQVGNGDILAEINELIILNGFTRNQLGSENYLKYYKHKNPHISWLENRTYQDRIKIKWEEKNPLTCVDMFEFKGAAVADIARKPGIIMRSYNNILFPENLPSGEYIGFYETGSVKEKYPETFPDRFGEYYITEKNVQFGYSGISEDIGDITYNGGIVSTGNDCEISFDGYTSYSSVNLLVSGITYISGEYARQLFPAVVKVYYADGTVEESFHISGPFCYSYRMALYSMLDNIVYSEFLGTNSFAKNFDTFWYPHEANVNSFFKIGNGINSRSKYSVDTAIGNGTVITIDTKNKPVAKVSISGATEEKLLEMGAKVPSKYITREDTPKEGTLPQTYLLPLDENQLKNVTGYENERDYYIAVSKHSYYPLYLHGVTGVKTTGSSYLDRITEVQSEIDALPDTFSTDIYEQLKVIKKKVDFLLNQGVSKGDFDKGKIEKFYGLLNYNVIDGKYVVYVSPKGNDNGSGSRNDPLKTLDGARKFVRTIKKDKPVEVIFLDGVYKFGETVNFTAEDSGTEEFPVTYKAENNAVFTTRDTVSINKFKLATERDDSRISPELIGKIYKLELNDLGIYPGSVPAYQSTGILGDGFEDVTFFVNNKEQLVAQWPNGESNYDTWADLVNSNINTGVIKAHSVRSKRWQGEKFAYFEGYPSPDYSNERNNIEIDGDLIKFKNASRFTLDEKHSRRYKVKHLLSELDVPGEWYLDRDTNVFYYYPIEDFNENSVIEFASRKLDLINITQTKYINFDGITFDKIRGCAIKAAHNLEKVNIYNCSFTNISNNAVFYDATTRYDGYLSGTSNFTDAANNCEIRNNRFINIGAAAIILKGGDREHLTGGNNVIANNYIYNAGNKQRCTPVIQVYGAYNYALNNEAHNLVFHALNHSGNENVIAYNEFYDALRDTGDCGVIYSGRQFLTRGTEIAYNYIHHNKHLDSRTSDNGVGIYLDDRLSGIYVHHNIIYPDGATEKGNGIQNGSGMHNIINYNTIVDAYESMTRSNRFTENYGGTDGTTVTNEIIRISGMKPKDKIIYDNGTEKILTESEAKGRYELYFEKYPEIENAIATLVDPNTSVPRFVEKYPFIKTHSYFVGDNAKYGNITKDIEEGNDLTKYRLLSLRAPMENTYIGNVTTTPWRSTDDIEQVYSEFGGVKESNIEEAAKDIFVDPENQDFRIKEDLGFEGYLDETFDLSQIGIQSDGGVVTNKLLEDDEDDITVSVSDYPVKNPRVFTYEEKSFNLTYPENNGKVLDVKNITFMWEKPVTADYYSLKIATDKEMTNVVYENDTVYHNFANITTLPEEYNTFYWTVEAKNISRQNSEQWKNADGVNVFYTYDGAYQELPVSIPFELSTEFNVDLFNDEGEDASDVGVAIGGSLDIGMYNLTNLKRIVPESGYFKYIDTIYHFPQVSYSSKTNNAVRVLSGNTYTYELKPGETGNYDEIKLAMSSHLAAKDYSIKAHYSDGSTEENKVALHQFYTTYYSYEQADTILVVDGVNSKGLVISDLNNYNKNKIYQTVIDTDENKELVSLEFIGGSGTVYSNGKNREYIFAITGVKTSRNTETGIVKSFFVNNYANQDKNLVVIITGTKNSKPMAKTYNITLEKSRQYQSFDIELPKDVYTWDSIQMLTWENGKLSPFAAKQNLFK